MEYLQEFRVLNDNEDLKQFGVEITTNLNVYNDDWEYDIVNKDHIWYENTNQKMTKMNLKKWCDLHNINHDLYFKLQQN